MSTTLDQSTALAVVDDDDCGEYAVALKADRVKVKQLSNFVRKTRNEIIEATDETERTFLQAGLMRTLRTAITGEMLEDIKSLAGTPVGFRTDLDNQSKGYPDHVIRDVAIQAMASGLRLIHNEVNIISGNMYPTVNGFERLIGELPGLTEFRYQFDVPARNYTGKTQKGTQTGSAFVSCRATWVYHGTPGQLDCLKRDDGDWRISLKCYGTDSDDLLIGKARSKLFRRVYRQLTGTDMASEVDGLEGESQTVEGTVVPAKATTGPAKAATEAATEAKPQPPSLKETLDRLEAHLHGQLPSAENISQCNKIQAETLDLLKRKGLRDEDTIECEEMIKRMCEARRQDIREGRGPRSNG